MPMIDMPVTPVAGAEVVIERRVGEAGNRGVSPNSVPNSVLPIKRVLGVCEVIASDVGVELKAQLGLSSAAQGYMYEFENREIDFREERGAKYTLVQPPRHGKLLLGGVRDPDEYMPNKGYLGRDSFVIQAEKDGIKITLRYFVLVDYSANLEHISCPEMPSGSFGHWKIARPSSDGRGQTPIDKLASQSGVPYVYNLY